MAALWSADALLAALLRDPRIHDLWLLAPLRSGSVLAPVFWWRRGGEPGLLRSGSTHMTGVITGADAAATLAGSAGAAYTGEGCRVTVEREGARGGRGEGKTGRRGDSVERMQRLGALAKRTDRLRAVANYLIEWLLLLLLGAGAVALRTGRWLPRPLALAPLVLPALLLLDGARRAGDTPAAVILLLLIAAQGFGLFARKRERAKTRGGTESGGPAADGDSAPLPPPFPFALSPFRVFARKYRTATCPGIADGLDGAFVMRDWRVLAATTVAACAVAVLAGDVLRWAIFGNSIRLGVRFYGVGNEFMGWWIGAALLAAGIPASGRVRLGAIALLLGVALLIGDPALGGKVGGLITALAAVIVEAWPALRRRRALLGLAFALAGVALLGFAAWDASRPPDQQTHLGRLALRMAAQGPRPLWLIARGKLLTNLRLTLGLWGALLAAGVWLVLEARRSAPEAEATRAVSRLLPVAAVAFLCNDSGVVAAALMLSYGVMAAGKTSGRG